MLSLSPLPFKTMMDFCSFPRLSGFTLLQISGPEAAAFLQAQTMNDVLTLTTGQWQWNGWLNPKGRVIALFALLKAADEQFLAILPDFPAAELLPRLQRFVLRARVQLRVVADQACAADIGVKPSHEAGQALDFSGDGGQRQLLLLPVTSPLLDDPNLETDARWYAMDLAHGLPRLAESQREAWTPQMLSLERFTAFSLKKGCYPGQEIVARTHYLGQAKRQLVRLTGTALVAGREVLDDTGRALGSLVCANAEGNEGLAVMAAADSALRLTNGSPVTAMPMQGGLQRPL
jgi:hypothetical protein